MIKPNYNEMMQTHAKTAAKSERTAGRQVAGTVRGRGDYTRSLSMKVGTVKLKVPQDRAGRFSTEVFERYQRSEKALVATLAEMYVKGVSTRKVGAMAERLCGHEMYVKGVSTRKVGAMAERLCGHEFSAATISNMVAGLDQSLQAWADRPLSEAMVYLILDARYEKVREAGTVSARAVQIAVGIAAAGRRHVRAVALATKESEWSWTELLRGLKARGLHGVAYVVSDSHEGLKQATREVS